MLEHALEIALKTIDPERGRRLRKREQPSAASGAALVGSRQAPPPGSTEAFGASAPKRVAAEASAPKPSRYIPREVFREVWRRDQGRCVYRDPLTKTRCATSHGLQIDHLKPLSLGGSTTLENLRLLCRTHNQLAAIRHFGKERMQEFVPNL